MKYFLSTTTLLIMSWLAAPGCSSVAAETPNVTDAGGTRSDASPDPGSTKLAPPDGCTEVSMGTLRNGTQLNPATYGQQPTLRGLLANDLGDPTFEDDVTLTIAYPSTAGTYSFSGNNAQALTCTHCLTVYEDYDAKKDLAARAYMAVDGDIEIQGATTPEQIEGRLHNVKLVQVSFADLSAPYRKSSIVPNGKCIWVESASFNSKVQRGCDPREPTACGGGTCYPQNWVGTDGLCVASTGQKKDGATCKLQDNGDSDCAPGYACSDDTCHRVCDFKSATPGCPANAYCNIRGLCSKDSEVYGNAPRDTAKIGEKCVVPGSDPCGAAGGLGSCVDIDAEAGPAQRLCHALARAQSECKAGEYLGYYGPPNDLSLGFCYTPTEAP